MRHRDGNDASVGANDSLQTRRCSSRRNGGDPDDLVGLLIELRPLANLANTFCNTLVVAFSVCLAHLS
ncbi:hypothetical protein FQV39_27790 [Bosea sp. F3-2]|uniref:hypothetical protein n=1 Tax=Bosea sp. F3-2 TaxID=2599640 RepID=UPI0011EBAD5F|nr:hypothetical protein [Bosea sp. F3-2]QEL25985.1 hypothetical protein FQV39_27790 [Bosea sp. F3-2]